MENRDDSKMLTAVCRLCGHWAGGPSGVDVQSTSARSRPTSASAANTPEPAVAAGSCSASCERVIGPPSPPALTTPSHRLATPDDGQLSRRLGIQHVRTQADDLVPRG